MKHNEALRSNLPKVQEDLNPIRVLSLFERISKEDCDLLDIHDRCGRARGPPARPAPESPSPQAGEPSHHSPGGPARLHSPLGRDGICRQQ
jgi:hypothetical protein